jgi:hypothetical protein
MFSDMLVSMSSRGPDSAGFAFYGDAAPTGKLKVVLQDPDPAFDWEAVAKALETRRRSGNGRLRRHGVRIPVFGQSAQYRKRSPLGAGTCGNL